MVQRRGRLAKGAKALREKAGMELSALFGTWVGLPDDFGGPKRRRLFFPLTGVLAVSRPGAFRRPDLPGDLV
jgi:hypothetical protein